MDDELIEFSKEMLKKGLTIIPEEDRILFKRMYSSKNVGVSIEVIVDNMAVEKLSRAMVQVKNTMDRLGKKI